MEIDPETPAAKWKVVIDTGVLLQAAISLTGDGPANRIFRLLNSDQIEVYISPRLRSEYELILYRDVIRAKRPTLTDAVSEAFLDRIDLKAILIHPVPPYINFPRDPKDEPILNLAIHIKADFIVARDNDLLGLKDSVKGISIVYPPAFLFAYSEAEAAEEKQ